MKQDGNRWMRAFAYNDGEIKDPRLGGRVFVLAAKAWVDMRQALYQSISREASKALLWNIGHRYGVSLTKKTLKAVTYEEEVARALAEIATYSGWGYVKLIGEVGKPEFAIEFRNCVFCVGVKDQKEPECSFLEGVISGILNTLYGNRFQTREVECIAKNDTRCLFAAKPQM